MRRTRGALVAAAISVSIAITTLMIIVLGLAHERASAAPTISFITPTPVATFTSGTLLVRRFGSGTNTIVLIPGLSSGPWEFATMIRALAVNSTVFALTLPGFDGQPTITAPYLPRVTDDIWAMLASQHSTMPVIIGHSLGGTLAYLLAEQHPHRLRGIVSIDGLPVFPGTENLTPATRLMRAKYMTTFFKSMTTAQFDASNMRYMDSIGTRNSMLATQMATFADRSDSTAVGEYAGEDLGLDLRPHAKDITIPVLLISPYNAADYAHPPLDISAMQKATYYKQLTVGVPNEKIVTVSPSRHYAQIDQPEQVQAAIDAFISGLH